MPERFLADATPGESPVHEDVQQLIEAEKGMGTQGVNRVWQASDSPRIVLTSDPNGVRISRDNGTTPPAQVIVDGTPAGGALTGTYPNPQLANATMDLLVPPGAIMAWAAGGAPAGWLLCHGQLVSRAAYPRLFAAIGTNFGAGDGSTTFGLPDLQGRVVVGVSGTHFFSQRGGAESAATPAHQHAETHNHTLQAHTHGQMSHTHDLQNHHHDLPAHGHTTNIDHDHPSQAGAATATSDASNSIQNGTGSPTTVPPYTHVHPVNLQALGTTNVATATGTVLSTQTPLPSNGSGQASPSATDIPSTPNTSDTNTGAGVTAGAAQVPTMPPFVVLEWIIRAA